MTNKTVNSIDNKSAAILNKLGKTELIFTKDNQTLKTNKNFGSLLDLGWSCEEICYIEDENIHRAAAIEGLILTPYFRGIFTHGCKTVLLGTQEAFNKGAAIGLGHIKREVTLNGNDYIPSDVRGFADQFKEGDVICVTEKGCESKCVGNGIYRGVNVDKSTTYTIVDGKFVVDDLTNVLSRIMKV